MQVQDSVQYVREYGRIESLHPQRWLCRSELGLFSNLHRREALHQVPPPFHPPSTSRLSRRSGASNSMGSELCVCHHGRCVQPMRKD